MSLKRTLDFITVLRLVKLLTTPFEETDAYKFGIIDKDGKFLKRFKDLKTDAEKDSFTYLNKLMFTLKRILLKGKSDKVNKMLTYAALMAAIKESKISNGMDDSAIKFLSESIHALLNEDTPTNQTGAPVSTDIPVKKKKVKSKIITRKELDNDVWIGYNIKLVNTMMSVINNEYKRIVFYTTEICSLSGK